MSGPRDRRRGALRGAVLLLLALMGCVMATGCGLAAASEREELVLGDIGWDENVAVSNLTKVLLEDEIGYDEVELRRLDVGPLYEGVSTGELGAFQDVWLPAHEDYVGGVEESVELLDPWFRGQTRFGIAVPSYMEIDSLEELNDTEADLIFGIEPGAVSMTKIPEEVMPAYGLEQDLVEASTPAMLSEVETRYGGGEEFAFIAWSPHWMNLRYDLTYLEDPKDAFEEVDDTVQLATVVNAGLQEEDPVAYALLDALTLDEEQLNELENTINEAGDPLAGARQWAGANPDVVEPWLDAARAAREA